MNISDNDLDQIESLLAQSLKGIHHLFDKNHIVEILQTPTEEIDFFSFDNMDKIQDLFTQLIGKKSFEEKVSYLNGLDRDSYEILLRAYFHIVDNTALSATELRH